jgi:hypothetical protein
LDKAGIRGDRQTFTGVEKEKAHNIVFHVDAGNVNVGVIGDVSGQANVATGLQPRAGNIDVDDVYRLVEEITAHVSAFPLSASHQDELKDALRELTTASSGKTAKTGMVRQALDRVLVIIGKAGETVVTLGIKAVVESWMRQHGTIP